jgi:uncharacterized BrkB/YihY/UPF0761 family membrane protein
LSARTSRARAHASEWTKRCQDWADRQPADSLQGVCLDAWKRYRDVDGPLQSALLSLYVFVAIVPALIVMQEYLESDPTALASNIVHHYNLSPSTAGMVRSVLGRSDSHHLGSALFAIAGALFFGLNFGKVLQEVHVRAWGLTLPRRQTDLGRYAVALLGLYGLILLLFVQLKELSGHESWVRLALAPGWVGLLTLYFLGIKRMLTHKLVSRRDMLPASVLTAAGIVVILVVSSYVMEFWVNLYARDYGGFGVVMAIFFWIGFTSTVIVLTTSLSPALAGRRRIRHEEPSPPATSTG